MKNPNKNTSYILPGRLFRSLAAAGCLLVGFHAAANAEQLKLSNDYLQITCDTETGQLTGTRIGAASPFMKGGFGNRTMISARPSTSRLQGIGTGQSIDILCDRDRLQITVVPGVPFVFVRPYITNSSAQEQRIDVFEAMEVMVLPEVSAKQLRALGSGGLRDVDVTLPPGKKKKFGSIPDPSGSYMFLAVANPGTRNGVVSGWISAERGSGILFKSVREDRTHIRARVDYGRLVLPAHSETASELFVIGAFDDARLGLETYADTIARYFDIHLPPQIDGYCTWYSRPNGGACDEKNIIKLAEAAKEKLVPYGFDFIQIDDKWQEGVYLEGPRMVFSKVRTNGPYPNGMQPVAEKLKSMGFIPGIWWIPFGGKHFDPFFADKQELFVKNEDGTPRAVRWGGSVLDLTRPATLDYVASNAKLLANDWGYDYFKLDGLWVGTGTENQYVNNDYEGNDKLGYGLVFNPNITPIEAYRNGLKTVRQAAGKPMFLLGCNVSQNMRSFGASFGLLDAMRIGPDNKPDWRTLLVGPWHGANRYFLHGRVWYNDPDPLYVRNDMPIEHAQLICSWISISGTLNVFSEWLPELQPDRVRLLQQTLPSHGLPSRPVDLFDNSSPNCWTLRDPNTDRTLVAMFNWDETNSATIRYAVDRLDLPPAQRYESYEFWTDRPGELADVLRADVPGGSCRVFLVRPSKNHPQVISTSRHLTQGIVGLAGEQWKEATKTLSGTSDLVADDPHELRILLPSETMKIGAVTANAPVQVTWKQQGRLVRVNLKSTRSGASQWRFTVQ